MGMHQLLMGWTMVATIRIWEGEHPVVNRKTGVPVASGEVRRDWTMDEGQNDVDIVHGYSLFFDILYIISARSIVNALDVPTFHVVHVPGRLGLVVDFKFR